ncbi:unnamed protein product [Scytosiphon promiscuus]
MIGDKEERHLFVLACLAQKAKRYSIARAAWEKYLSVRPSDPKARHNLGVCLDNLGDKASALANFERAFELHPGMAESGANAAGLLIQAGEAERASKLCYLALEGNPECAVALFNLNTALRMAGRPSEAISLSWQWIVDRLPPGTQDDGSGVSLTDVATRKSQEDARNWVVDEPRHPRPPPPPPPPRYRCHGPVPSPARCRATGDPGCRTPVGGGFEAPTGNHDSGAQVCCIRDYAARKGSAMDKAAPGEVTVACIRWGRKYGPEYVQRLAAGVRRHLRRSHRFVCFTDDANALGEMAGVVVKPLGTAGYGEWRGWWHKAFLFSR